MELATEERAPERARQSMYTATYSPEDNKLRLYAVSRLDPDTYARVRGAGFIWAPKQELFVAPAWTPDREDLLTELAGEIGDEDTSLVDRAEQRAERFEEYSDKREGDAERARQAVSAIADNIPLGQPILVGHHSERRARKDAEKIENGMRRAVQMWKTAKYWEARARGAILHAKYKERPDVRARRIKGIEADRRKQDKYRTRALKLIAHWEKLGQVPAEFTTRQHAIALANLDGGIYEYGHEFRRRDEQGRPVGEVYHTGPLYLWDAAGGNVNGHDPEVYAVATPEEVRDKAIRRHRATIAHAERWIAHLDNRLAYERAMLAESGGLITDRTEYPIVPGGRVLVRGEWSTVIRVNRKDGKICSVTTNARYVSVRGIEEVKDYQPPAPGAEAAAKAIAKQPPIVNEDVPDAVHMTKSDFDQRRKYSDFWRYEVVRAEGEYAAYRRPVGVKSGGSFQRIVIFFTDQKVKPRPRADEQIERPKVAPPERVETRPTYTPPAPTAYDQLEDQLRVGVQVVSAPQLFPTPEPVARQVVELADIQPGMRVLEPSAGTGALAAQVARGTQGTLLCVEVDRWLAAGLQAAGYVVECADFLQWNGAVTGSPSLLFDRIVMNPPFKDGADIKHIEHARRMLAPGGRLVAVCAAGPRQRARYEDSADTTSWIDLPPGSFEAAGTGVNAAIVVIDREAQP